jgi:uncharacterized RDD family membrane protein YckC
MKCSKCGYLGFEIGDRCRNCGYEFSLAQSYDAPELTIRRDSTETHEPYDFPFDSAGAAPSIGSMALDPRATRRPTPALPLFTPADDDTPLITKASPPRAPLAVRRSTPDTARLRSATSAKTPGGDLLELRPARMSPAAAASSPATPAVKTPANHQDAGIARRLAAGAIDLGILLAIDIVVVYFTMQICGIGFNEMRLLPKGPLVVFLLVQNVGYLVTFTARGQTLGKMATGIKVVAGDCDGSLDMGCALKRTMLSLLLAIPAGLGLLPALFDSQHRGLHDRFAGTRVVRATA